MVRRLAVVLAVLGSAHYYIWLRFVVAPRLPEPWFAVATIAIIGLAPSLIIAALVSRRMPRARAAPLLRVVFTWFGIAVYLLLAAALGNLACALAPVSPRAAALAGLVAVAATVLYGFVHLARGPRVRRVRVPLAKLPAAADGYSIVQLTDVHVGPALGREFVTGVVEQVMALQPDLIVLTGDTVDGRLVDLAPHVEPLRGLHARDGVFAVTGNHEYYWNAEAWVAHLGSLGIRFLRNERVSIASGFELAGVDDSSASEDVPRALAGRDPAVPVVLLAHHPRTIERAAAAGCDLQLSGHTHGGQLLPLGWLARLFEPRVAGLARFGATWLYVSEGTGFWGPALRIGTTSEITLLTLTRPDGRG